MQIQNIKYSLEQYNQPQKKSHLVLKTAASSALLGAGGYLGYKKITSSPSLTKNMAGLFNEITGSLMKGKSKNLLTNKAKVGIMISVVATFLTGIITAQNAYLKGKAEGKNEILQDINKLGGSTTQQPKY